MALRNLFAIGVAACLGALACDYPEFAYRPESAASTGVGGNDTGPATQASTVTASTSGSGGGPTCEFGKVGACGEGRKCALLDVNTEEVGCTDAGGAKDWSYCTRDADCLDGSLCDPRYNVCKPLCGSAKDCHFTVKFGAVTFQSTGACIRAERAPGKTLTKAIYHCTSDCEPSKASPCDTTHSGTCILRDKIGFDCGQSGNKPADAACKTDSECGNGRVCVMATASTAFCRVWCDDPGNYPSQCPGTAPYCAHFDPAVTYLRNGVEVEYGPCIPTN